MKKYKFLFKPVFFILNLLFATWLVFRIEKITPSDFGRYRSLFEDQQPVIQHHTFNKKFLRKLCLDYKTGTLDSIKLEQELDEFLVRQQRISMEK
ncbi:MAG TPA: hypothetical protein VNZ49_08890 [Bacteroidia bacterium]|jgi:hypothetical protein|nr:hypothetical protein [Bacteroidia bacterium]